MQDGPMVLADIGGYTEYLQAAELVHAAEVLGDLLETVVDGLSPTLPLVKLEGDAVFCAADATAVDAVSVSTAVSDTYAAFRRRQRSIAMATTCECAACTRIPGLGLKVVVHRGRFVAHDVAGHKELLGAEVVLAHRLLKNSVTASTGLTGYALMTDAAQQGLSSEGMCRYVEHYSDVGEVQAWIVDLEKQWLAQEARPSVQVRPADAFASLEAVVGVSPARAWSAHTNPAEQRSWRLDLKSYRVDSGGAPRGAGTVIHCVHGRGALIQQIVNWNPHSHLSYVERSQAGEMLWTVDLTPSGASSTRLRWSAQLAGGRAQRALMSVLGARIRRTMDANFRSLASYLNAASP